MKKWKACQIIKTAILKLPKLVKYRQLLNIHKLVYGEIYGFLIVINVDIFLLKKEIFIIFSSFSFQNLYVINTFQASFSFLYLGFSDV